MGGGHAEMFKISLLRSYSITQPVTLLLTLGRDCGELQGYCFLASDGPGKAQIVLIWKSIKNMGVATVTSISLCECKLVGPLWKQYGDVSKN